LSDHGILKEKLLEYHREHSLQKIISAEHLLNNISLNNEEIENISTCTVQQWKTKEWYLHKGGIITASNQREFLMHSLNWKRV
jgi:hypothetical protein